MNRFYDGSDAEEIAIADSSKGERYRAEAEAWIKENPDAWGYIVEQALASARMHRMFGMKALCEYIRWHMQVNKGKSEFKLNNNHTSAFTRILTEQHPEVEPYVRTRSAAVDLCA